MTSFHKYRDGLAVFMLLLYAFIATPVQFWHHHNNSTGKAPLTFSKSAEQHPFFSESGSLNDKDCPVCSHKYSAYNDDVFFPEQNAIFLNVPDQAQYSLNIIQSENFSLTNKGPPARA